MGDIDVPMAVIIFWLSWLWTAMASVGLVFSSLVWNRARGDLAVIIGEGIDGGDLIVAKRNFRNARLRTVHFVLFVIVGLVSSITPPRPDSDLFVGTIGPIPIYADNLRLL